MSQVVLCVDNGNPYMEDTKKYLSAHGCKLYAFPEKGEDASALLERIERTEGRIDILLFGAGGRIPADGAIGDGLDCEGLLEQISGQINRMQTAIEASLPLLRRGQTKCIGMITGRSSSISHCRDVRDYGRHMAWAGMNMVGKLYFNRLRPEGFRFRWYCAEEGSGGMTAGEYLLTRLCYDEKEPYIHSDENRLVMRDAYLREIPW